MSDYFDCASCGWQRIETGAPGTCDNCGHVAGTDPAEAPKFASGWWVGVNGHDADMIEDSGEWAPVIDGTHDDGGVVAWVHPAHASKVAAAPDLYAALERCLPLLVQLGDLIGNGPINPNDPNSIGERCDAILQARSALGKAGV